MRARGVGLKGQGAVFPADGGDVGRQMQAIDWRASPLGPPEEWSPVLRSTAELVLASKAAIALFWGPDHIALYNDAYAATIGDKHPGALGRPARESWPEIWRGMERMLVAGLAGESGYDRDLAITMRRHGYEEPTHFDVAYSPVREADGAVGGVLSIVSETTDRWIAERHKAVQLELWDRLRTLHDPTEIARVASQTVGQHLGVAAAGYAEMDQDGENVVIEADWTDGTRPSIAGRRRMENIGQGLAAAMLSGQTVIVNDLAMAPNDPLAGQPGAVRAGVVVPIMHEGRFAAAAFAASGAARAWTPAEIAFVGEVGHRVWDALARARSVIAVAASEALFRSFAQTQPSMVWTSPPGGEPDWYNDQCYRYTGMDHAELDAAGGWGAMIHDDDMEHAVDLWQASLRTGEPYEVELRLRRADGVFRWHIARALPIRDPDGEIVRWVGNNTDVDDQKNAEALLEARLEERTGELMAVEESLRQAQKMEAIGQLTGGVAHDFNNMLTVIRSSADLLRLEGVPEARRRRYVDAIAETADRAAKLTAQLLAFARRQSLKPEVFDAGERLNGVSDMLKTVLGARIPLTIEAAASLPVEADVGQFETALVNMTINARDAMEGEGRLTVSATSAVRGGADFVAITIADTGGGIAPEVLPRIFEPFFTTKDVGRGTGLGLSQVFGFAKQSGGEIEVASEPGRGAVFTLYLPRVEAPAAVSPPRVEAAPAPAAGRILVVEDNAQVGAFSIQLLDDLGYRPELATDAAAALATLEQTGGDFDLVFSDVVMPGMSGVELGREIRARWPGLPVVLTSGYSHVLAEDARHGFALLRKPYSVEDLSAVLREVMTTPAPGLQPGPA